MAEKGATTKTRTITVQTTSSPSNVSEWIWPGAMTLSDYILDHPGEFHRKRVLELGAGTGLTASVLLGIHPKHVVVTDYEESALKTLERNMKINFERLRQPGGAGKSTEGTCDNGNIKAPYEVARLDWCYFRNEDIVRMTPDVVIGSDLVYSPQSINPLLNVIESCVVEAKVSAVIMVCMVRNPDAFSMFEKRLKARKALAMEYMPLPELSHFADNEFFGNMMGSWFVKAETKILRITWAISDPYRRSK